MRTSSFLERKKILISQYFSLKIRMPATGIEPVLYCYNRILSPARLPVPPRRRMDGGGFEPPKQVAADLQSVPFGHSGICPLLSEQIALTRIDYSTWFFIVQDMFSSF